MKFRCVVNCGHRAFGIVTRMKKTGRGPSKHGHRKFVACAFSRFYRCLLVALVMFTLQRPAEALNDYFWVQIAPDSPCTDFPCWGWQFTVQITGFNWCTQSPDSMLVNYGDCGPYFAYNFCWDESAGWNVSPLTPPPAGWYWAGVGADQYGRPLLYVSCAPPPPGPYIKRCDRKQGGDQHGGCASCGMARYSAHAMLASLNIEEKPIGYAPPRGPAADFIGTY